MAHFVHGTPLTEIGERRYRAELDGSWRAWGPAGGYIAATALRAAGLATDQGRPASFHCLFLSVARFEPVELAVEPIRAGRRSEALRVRMTQGDATILEATVWTIPAETEGLEHDYTEPPAVPDPSTLQTMRELEPERPPGGYFANFDHKPIDWAPEKNEARDPVMRNWIRFREADGALDRFEDAARSVLLLDGFSWPSVWPAHPSDGPLPWIAPNLDLHVRFHHDARASDWLLSDCRAEIAADGVIGCRGAIWREDRKLAAEGSTQLFCRPRPERFR